MSRFFAFGCSYTRYSFATWADYVGANFDEYCNYGRGGCSNTFIMNRFIEANEVHNINSNDYVIVMVTGFGRFSYMPKMTPDKKVPEWVTNGDLYEYYTHTRDKKIEGFLEHMYSDDWAVYMSWIAIKTIKQMLDAKNIPHKFLMSMDNRHYLETDGSKWGKKYKINQLSVNRAQDIYTMLDDKQSFDEWKGERYVDKDYTIWTEENNRSDHHPTQKMHYEYLKDKLPEFSTDKSLKAFNKVEKIFINDSQPKQGHRFVVEYQNYVLRNLL